MTSGRRRGNDFWARQLLAHFDREGTVNVSGRYGERMSLLIDEPAVLMRPTGAVRVAGADRLTYLHTLLSQDLEQAAAGTAADFLHLDAKGNPIAAGRALVLADEVLLVVPPSVAADLATNLEKFKFLMQVEAADVSEGFRLASVRGPEPVEVSQAPTDPLTVAASGDGLLVRDRTQGVDLLGGPAWVSERMAALDLPTAKEAEWEAWRIRNGEPGWHTEISTGRRAQELGLLPTHVHLRKGCYPGQESIAKIYNLGRPRRALAVVELDGPVQPGDQLHAGGKAGEVTSAAPLGDGSVALALLPVDRETRTVLGDGTVTGDGVSGRVRCRVGEGLPQPGA